jgi:hypothetical protein
MADFELGRSFDVVTCFFASLPYLASLSRMRQAVICMARHLSAGGILFVEPGLAPAVYREGEVVHSFRRTPDGAIASRTLACEDETARWRAKMRTCPGRRCPMRTDRHR